MSELIVTCDVPFTVDALGYLKCSGELSHYERPITVGDLSQSEIGELSSVIVLLFSMAFVFRFVRKMFLAPGRF